MKIAQGSLIILLFGLCGCTTISSTALSRSEDNFLYSNSNGSEKSGCKARPFKGVPITIRVPTHVDIAVTETYFLQVVGNELQEVKMFNRNLDVIATPVETEKIFTVDFPRPVSGSLAYNITFGDDENAQYLKSFQNTIIDNTIKDVSTAFAQILPLLGSTQSAGAPAVPDQLKSKLIQDTRTVAWKRFDIDAPDFEQQIHAFLDTHINNCHSCFNNDTDFTFHNPINGPN